jgi:hypothetical protein
VATEVKKLAPILDVRGISAGAGFGDHGKALQLLSPCAPTTLLGDGSPACAITLIKVPAPTAALAADSDCHFEFEEAKQSPEGCTNRLDAEGRLENARQHECVAEGDSVEDTMENSLGLPEDKAKHENKKQNPLKQLDSKRQEEKELEDSAGQSKSGSETAVKQEGAEESLAPLATKGGGCETNVEGGEAEAMDEQRIEGEQREQQMCGDTSHISTETSHLVERESEEEEADERVTAQGRGNASFFAAAPVSPTSASDSGRENGSGMGSGTDESYSSPRQVGKLDNSRFEAFLQSTPSCTSASQATGVGSIREGLGSGQVGQSSAGAPKGPGPMNQSETSSTSTSTITSTGATVPVDSAPESLESGSAAERLRNPCDQPTVVNKEVVGEAPAVVQGSEVERGVEEEGRDVDVSDSQTAAVGGVVVESDIVPAATGTGKKKKKKKDKKKN